MKTVYKEIRIMKWCTRCGSEFRPERYSWQNKRCICVKCVGKEIAAWRKKNPEKWREIVRRYRKGARPKRLPWVVNAYLSWKRWVARNPDRRREIARNSYRKHKKSYI